METKGVVYYNIGGKCLVRLVVSLMTLRRHYHGAATVFLEGEHPDGFPEALRREFGVDVVYRPVISHTTGVLVHKIEISMDAPYDLNVWIDSDTVVTGDFSELFEMARGCDLVVTHFAYWRTNGGAISRRIERYREFCPEYIDAAVKFGPAVNTGVYAWDRRSSKIFPEWLRLASWGDGKMFIADEVACQVLLPRYDCKVAPPMFNTSVNHDKGQTKDPRIVHYHGKKHCNIESSPLTELWLSAFVDAASADLCGVRRYVGKQYGDRRLHAFLNGRYGNAEWVARAKAAISSAPSPRPSAARRRSLNSAAGGGAAEASIKPGDVTVVTACDMKYVDYLAKTLPNWVRHKGVGNHPMIVYVHGFDNVGTHPKLEFLRRMPNVRIVAWDLPSAESQRERMLTAFVLGAARDVATPYWIKIDADAYSVNDAPLYDDDMGSHAICGHKWGYSKLNVFVPLVEWANRHPAFAGTPRDAVDPSKIDGRRYKHPRVASFVQFHRSEFVRMAAEIAGDRLPVPSHDTYLWYVATRLGLSVRRHNFKRHNGMTNKTDFLQLVRRLEEEECAKPA